MLSLTFTIEIIIAVIMMIIMHISMNITDGVFLKNLIVYSVLCTFIMIILGLRGLGNILFMAIFYCLEGLPMVWIMQKIYDSVSFKFFIVITVISWFIVKDIIGFLFAV